MGSATRLLLLHHLSTCPFFPSYTFPKFPSGGPGPSSSTIFIYLIVESPDRAVPFLIFFHLPNHWKPRSGIFIFYFKPRGQLPFLYSLKAQKINGHLHHFYLSLKSQERAASSPPLVQEPSQNRNGHRMKQQQQKKERNISWTVWRHRKKNFLLFVPLKKKGKNSFLFGNLWEKKKRAGQRGAEKMKLVIQKLSFANRCKKRMTIAEWSQSRTFCCKKKKKGTNWKKCGYLNDGGGSLPKSI